MFLENLPELGVNSVQHLGRHRAGVDAVGGIGPIDLPEVSVFEERKRVVQVGEVMQRWIESLDLVDGRLSKKRNRSLSNDVGPLKEALLENKVVWDGGSICKGRIANPYGLSVGVHHLAERGHYGYIRMGFHHGDRLREAGGSQEVVSTENLHVLAACIGERPVPVTRHSQVLFVLNDPDSRVARSEVEGFFVREIGGLVVHHYELKVLKGLIEGTLESFAEVGLAVVTRHEDGDSGMAGTHS